MEEERQKQEQFIRLPKIIDDRGNLSFIEEDSHIPFKIARTYWIYDVPGGEFRGSHAFRTQEEFIVALSGSFDVVLEDGEKTYRYSLNRSYMGIHVPCMTWRKMENFSTNSLCLILASRPYEEADYIRDYEEFKVVASSSLQARSHSFLQNTACTQAIGNGIEFCLPLQRDPRLCTVYNCNVFELPKVHDRRGNLTSLNNGIDIPFNVKRVFYIYDIPSGAMRGAHAHKEAWQFIIAASSSFDILLDDGRNKKMVHLDRPNFGLLVPPGIWCRLQNFSSAAVCMVLTSHKYDASDYIGDYDEFLSFRSCK